MSVAPINRRKRIRVGNCGEGYCFVCGKDRALRKDAVPAPICLYIDANYNVESGSAVIGGQLCMACAKMIVNRLDSVIEQVEAKYKPSFRGRRERDPEAYIRATIREFMR